MTAEQLAHKAKTHLAAALDLLQQGLIPGADGQMRSALRTLDELWPLCQECGHQTWLPELDQQGVCQCCYFAEMRRLREECEVCHGDGCVDVDHFEGRHTTETVACPQCRRD